MNRSNRFSSFGRHFLLSIVVIMVFQFMLLTFSTTYGFTVKVDSSGQRTDGSKLWDIWYTIGGLTDTVKVGIIPVTESGETLTCVTFVNPSDTGTITSNGSKHVIWNFGVDVPDREFYNDRVKIRMYAAKGGVVPGLCCGDPITDFDGNSYGTVLIGTQCWMAENLKVTHYRDGTPIPHVTVNATWMGLTSGAYCEFDNNPSTVPNYGRYYNWYAVNDTCEICPPGWHVPTDAEWQTLVDYLGGSGVAGGKLKETGTARWDSPNTGATNETGFTAVGGGRRYFSGVYATDGQYGWYWSSTESDASNAWTRGMYYLNTGVNRSAYGKNNGLSVRCIMDH